MAQKVHKTGYQSITQMYQSLLFEQSESFQQHAFSNTPLGKLYQAIPFESLSKKIPEPQRALSGKGCKPWFDVKGGIALQVLKSCYRISDAMLIEQLNGNWEMQMFCGIQLKATERIKDKDIVGRWRSYLGRHLDIDQLQLCCVQHWLPYMQHTHTGFTDATVFESYIEYPTDAGLLWKSCENVFTMISQGRKYAGLRPTRINHQKRRQQWLRFAKRRRKSKRQIKNICRRLLKYLTNLLKELDRLLQKASIQLGV